MGKFFFAGVVAFIVIVIGMLIYPAVHSIWSGIDVSGFTSLEQAGMVLASYAMLFWMGYAVYTFIKK